MYIEPSYLLVVGIIGSNRPPELVEILKKYFKKIPHIEYRDTKLAKMSTFYIVDSNTLMSKFILGFQNIANTLSVMQYSIYERCNKLYYISEQGSPYRVNMPVIVSLSDDDRLKLRNLLC